MDKIDEIKEDIYNALKLVGLDGEVSMDEIEKEIIKADTSFQSLLILGIIARIMNSADEKAMGFFVPAITEWKNYLPHNDLGGLSPAEHMEKYPPGPYEIRFISEMMNDYQKRLEINSQTGKAQAGSPNEPFDVENDFDKFQKEYLNRIPLEQPFGSANNFMTIKEIIVKEREINNRPKKDIEKIGIKIFAENTAEGMGGKIAEITDNYYTLVKELDEMRKNPKLRNKKRVHAIRKQLEKEEAFHRCGPAPHQFYCNLAAALFLDEEKIESVLSLLDKSLSYQDDYEPALKTKQNLENYYKD